MRDPLLGEVERRMVELVEWLAPQPVEASGTVSDLVAEQRR